MSQRLFRVALFFALLGNICQVLAQSQIDQAVVEKSLTVVPLPKSPPQKADLFAFEPSASSRTLQFFLDTKNISVEKDIVRYVVLIRNPEGGEQILYAGIDCDQSQKILYGFLLPDNNWQRTINPTWQNIMPAGYNNYPRYLQSKGMCVGNSANSNVAEMIQILKSNDFKRKF